MDIHVPPKCKYWDRYLRCKGTPPSSSAIFLKGDNFRNFFVSLPGGQNPTPKVKNLLLEEQIRFTKS